MQQVKGTQGYSGVTDRFIKMTETVPFDQLHASIIEFIPSAGRALDVGAGIGRDASVLAEMGHDVVAVEPTAELRTAARVRYDSPRIQWVEDSLPALARLDRSEPFDFILASAVWHHLDGAEQEQAMLSVSTLLRHGGVFALSLRHGPAGVGTHVFPTDGSATVKYAEGCGLTELLHLRNQASMMQGKAHVSWTRLAFLKP